MTTPTASRRANPLPHAASAARRDAGTSSAAPQPEFLAPRIGRAHYNRSDPETVIKVRWQCVTVGAVSANSGAGRVKLRGVEPHGAEVVSRGQVHVGVQGSGQVPQQGNGWLGAALFGALNLIGGHANPLPFVGLCRVAAVVPSTGLLRPHRPVDLKLRLFD